MRALIATVLLATFGCASPSFVGHWHADPVPPGVQSLSIDVRGDGTWASSLKDLGDSEAAERHGQWVATGERSAALTQPPQEGCPATTTTARLVGDDRLQMPAPDGAGTFGFTRVR